MTRSKARGMCLVGAARVVALYGRELDGEAPDEVNEVVASEARALAGEFVARAAALGVRVGEPVQLELFAEVAP